MANGTLAVQHGHSAQFGGSLPGLFPPLRGLDCCLLRFRPPSPLAADWLSAQLSLFPDSSLLLLPQSALLSTPFSSASGSSSSSGCLGK